MFRKVDIHNQQEYPRDVVRSQEVHTRHLRSVRSNVRDLQTETFFDHVGNNYKGVVQRRDRYMRIKRENNSLLMKLSTIMQKPQNHSHLVNEQMSHSRGSLNLGARRENLRKITQENHRFLNRLQESKSTYSVRTWEKESKKQRKILKKICAFPLSSGSSNKRGNKSHDYGHNGHPFTSVNGLPKKNSKISKSFSNLTSKKKKPGMKRSSSVNKTVHLKRGVKIGVSYYIVEISSNLSDAITITGFEVESPDSHTLHLNPKESEIIMEECGGDYEELLQHVMIKGTHIYLHGLEGLLKKPRKRTKSIGQSKRSKNSLRDSERSLSVLPRSLSHDSLKSEHDEVKYSSHIQYLEKRDPQSGVHSNNLSPEQSKHDLRDKEEGSRKSTLEGELHHRRPAQSYSQRLSLDRSSDRVERTMPKSFDRSFDSSLNKSINKGLDKSKEDLDLKAHIQIDKGGNVSLRIVKYG